MMNHTFKRVLPALCTAVLCLAGSQVLSASAYSADDVAAKARASGWPEYLIQQGYNQWASGEYTQAQLDRAYDSIENYNEQTGQKIADALDVEYVSTASNDSAASEPTQAAAEAPTQAQQGDAAPADPAVVNEVPTTLPVLTPITVTKTDGTTEERISKADFINMTMDQKKEYVASLTADSKMDFMNSLSVEERNSILKQLPAAEKAEIIQTYVDTAKDMGMNVSLDKVSDNNVSMTIRNEEGRIIGQTAVGTIIDETGISHTVPLMTAFLASLVSVFGFVMLYRRLSHMDSGKEN